MEQWKQIVVNGVEYPYEISTKGRVRNKSRQIMRTFPNKDGYLRVNLSRNNRKRNFSVHRLVATMFIPNPDNLPEVDHIDRNRQNNCVENLRWVSKQQNVDNSDCGKGGKRVKCVETGVIYDNIFQASVETGANYSNIVQVCRGKRKTTGGFHWEYVD